MTATSGSRRVTSRPRRVLIAQLVGKRVETTGGKRLGRVVDVELVVDVGGVRVAGVEIGRIGFLNRLRVVRPLAERAGSGDPHVVRWEDVERVEKGRVVVRAGPSARS